MIFVLGMFARACYPRSAVLCDGGHRLVGTNVSTRFLLIGSFLASTCLVFKWQELRLNGQTMQDASSVYSSSRQIECISRYLRS